MAFLCACYFCSHHVCVHRSRFRKSNFVQTVVHHSIQSSGMFWPMGCCFFQKKKKKTSTKQSFNRRTQTTNFIGQAPDGLSRVGGLLGGLRAPRRRSKAWTSGRRWAPGGFRWAPDSGSSAGSSAGGRAWLAAGAAALACRDCGSCVYIVPEPSTQGYSVFVFFFLVLRFPSLKPHASAILCHNSTPHV